MDANILIVDDDTAIRESMREYIEMSGYQTHMAASAEEAAQILAETAMDNPQIPIGPDILNHKHQTQSVIIGNHRVKTGIHSIKCV